MLTAAIVAALAGAALFALAAVLQQREAFDARDSRSIDAGLLWRLAHRPVWLVGIAADVGSAGLHVLALALGPVDLVQPLGVTGMVFAVPLAALIHRRRIRALDVVAVMAVLVGLAVVLKLLGSSAGSQSAGMGNLVQLIAAALALTAVALIAAGPAVVPGWLRGLMLAAAAGSAFGVAAVLVSTVMALSGRPDSGPSVAVALGGVAVLVVTGYLALQNAYRAGHFASSLAVAVVVDPLVAIVAAAFLLHQPLPSAPGQVTLLVLSAVVVVAGLAALVSSPAQLFPSAIGEPPVR